MPLTKNSTIVRGHDQIFIVTRNEGLARHTHTHTHTNKSLLMKEKRKAATTDERDFPTFTSVTLKASNQKLSFPSTRMACCSWAEELACRVAPHCRDQAPNIVIAILPLVPLIHLGSFNSPSYLLPFSRLSTLTSIPSSF